MLCQETATVSLTLRSKQWGGRGAPSGYMSVCVCMIHVWTNSVSTTLLGDSERHVDLKRPLTLSVIWPQQQITVSLHAVFVTIKWHLLKKSSGCCLFLLLISPSFDVLLIWHAKVSFVASTSAFILLSAPSAQWCKSHMLLFHMTVLLLLLWWHHLLSSDHSLDKDRMRCHLPPSRSTSHCVHSFRRASSCWIHESKNHVSFHYQYWWAPCLSFEQCREHITQNAPFPSCLSRDVFVFIYPISPLATAWPCIRLTLAPGACNVCERV